MRRIGYEGWHLLYTQGAEEDASKSQEIRISQDVGGDAHSTCFGDDTHTHTHTYTASFACKYIQGNLCCSVLPIHHLFIMNKGSEKRIYSY